MRRAYWGLGYLGIYVGRTFVTQRDEAAQQFVPADAFGAAERALGGEMPYATLLVDLPDTRYRFLSADRRAPAAGDKVLLDQGFTGSNGEPMVLVYFPGVGPVSHYEAEVYEAELE